MSSGKKKVTSEKGNYPLLRMSLPNDYPYTVISPIIIFTQAKVKGISIVCKSLCIHITTIIKKVA